MIFVTVGTHEQPFNRLVEFIDSMKGDKRIDEEVFVQTGYSTYFPKYCKWEKLVPYNQMEEYIAKARIVITHGGPASFLMPLQMNKIPIVVPRQSQFDEHVNNHQLEFAEEVARRQRNIVVVKDISELGNAILNYNSLISNMSSDMHSNNESFNEKFEKIVEKL